MTTRLSRLRLQLVAGELAQRIGANIRERREELGLTQQGLADLIPSPSVNNQRISEWERGIYTPTDKHLKMLAGALKVDFGYFHVDHARSTPSPFAAGNGETSQLDRIETMLSELLRRTEGAAVDETEQTAVNVSRAVTRAAADALDSAAESRRAAGDTREPADAKPEAPRAPAAGRRRAAGKRAR